jgi:4-coumarate--CoA ligase
LVENWRCCCDEEWLVLDCRSEEGEHGSSSGYPRYTQNCQELIKVNALQVAPAELEAVLLEFDPIADAAAVGITLDGQEWPRAYVALKDEFVGKTTAEAIHAHMKTKVAKHKQLVGGIEFVEEVPKLQSGKIMRKVVKEWAKRDAEKMNSLPKARL